MCITLLVTYSQSRPLCFKTSVSEPGSQKDECYKTYDLLVDQICKTFHLDPAVPKKCLFTYGANDEAKNPTVKVDGPLALRKEFFNKVANLQDSSEKLDGEIIKHMVVVLLINDFCRTF